MKRPLLGMTAVTVLALAVILATGSPQLAYGATTIMVNTTNDEAVTDGQCSLREAISNANANSDTTGGDCVAGSPGADTIDLSTLNRTIALVGDLPAISDDLTISGPGANALTVDANQLAAHVFSVGAGITATITGLTMTGASNPGGEGGAIQNGILGSSSTLTLTNSVVRANTALDGGGIANYGTLTLNSSTVTNNTGATSGAGGGVVNFGSLTLNDSTINANAVGSNGFGGGIFDAQSAEALTVNNSTISGNVAASGGGIENYGAFVPVTVNGSTISGNTAGFPDVAGNGGGIDGSGTFTISDSTISGNTAHNGGGGIFNGGTLTITDTTISGNTAAFGGGGGIHNESVVKIVNSTISGNNANFGGGIEDQSFTGRLTLDYSTVTGNTDSGSGGGIFALFSPPEVLSDSIIAGNPGGNCFGSPSGFGATDAGYNLEDGGSCGFSAANNSFPNTDPLLDSAGLKDNGGSTQTIALQPGSPAIDAIPTGVNGCRTTITTDQRGVSRPQGPGCDMGAFEVVAPVADLSITESASPNPVISGNRLTYTITVTNQGPQGATGVTVTDPLPDAVHFNSMSSTQGTCTRSTTRKPPKNGTVSCSLGALASAATARITIVVTATTPGTLTNTASVKANESDPNPANNSATATTTVIGT